MNLKGFVKTAAVLAVVAAVGYGTRDRWQPFLLPSLPLAVPEPLAEIAAPTNKVIVGEQTQENLGLKAEPLKAQTYWKTIPVPGMVVDRPGVSDRGVVAAATGTVTSVKHFPGDTVRPGEVLFTLKLLSESLQLTQSDLYKTSQEIALAEAARKRLVDGGGSVPETRLIEADAQITRLKAAVNSYRQELLTRGFSPGMIDGVAGGTFVKEMSVAAPPATTAEKPSPENAYPSGTEALSEPATTYEVQELKVELGQQVQAGQTLCLLADHRLLAVEGRAFRDETPLLERSVREKWPVGVDFQEDAASDWGDVNQTFFIRYMANTIDPVNRTFAFRLPLENQSRVVEHYGRPQTLWRYRPGQKVWLMVRVEEIKNVFVLPADAVARDGPQAFVFTQNVNTFERKPVRVVLQDRRRVVVANDGSVTPGSFAVRGGAAQLNRMVKAAGVSGVPKGYHVHADGSLHKHDDGGK